jgi:endonuclease/exonuclease/phosphatase family metal-dependent hydrolase
MWTALILWGFSASAAEPPAAEQSAEIEVLCTNIWGLAWPLSQHRRQRLPQIFEQQRFDTYDLVAVQELWRGARRRVQGAWFLPDGRGDSGLALAGRLAAGAQIWLEPFEERVGVERFKRKGILVAEVPVEGLDQPLRVFVTHLQAGGSYGEVRQAQVQQLARLLQAYDGPALVLGDFNLHTGNPADNEAERVLLDAGLRDVAIALDRLEPTYVASNHYAWPSAHGQRFDRVYVRDGGGVTVTPLEVEVLHSADPLSDHQPIRVRLRVQEG